MRIFSLLWWLCYAQISMIIFLFFSLNVNRDYTTAFYLTMSCGIFDEYSFNRPNIDLPTIHAVLTAYRNQCIELVDFLLFIVCARNCKFISCT